MRFPAACGGGKPHFFCSSLKTAGYAADTKEIISAANLASQTLCK